MQGVDVEKMVGETEAFRGRKAAYYTLGCKLNYSETSTFGRLLKELGVEPVGRGEAADICLINTCSVTDVADHKSRQAIRRMVRSHPGAIVVVTGCYAQLRPEEVVGIEGVDLVLGSEEKSRLLDYLLERWRRGKGEAESHTVRTKDIRSFVDSCSRGNRTRYFLKVQDGCDYYCTYCTVPYARGRSRNGSIDSLVEQARRVAAEGGKEIVITGVNIGDFGKSTGESLLELLRRLDAVEGIERYRISSMEPDLISDDIIEAVAESRAIMPHFHIPLQSGSDAVLRLMGRHYDSSLFAEKVRKIKSRMKGAFIGVDVMVGSRGETREMFDETERYLESLDVSQLHVFPYSERPGTAALRIEGRVSAAEKKRRGRRLLALSEAKRRQFYNNNIGGEALVLFERSGRGGSVRGFTENYIRVELSEGGKELDNEIRRVRLGGFSQDGKSLLGTLI